MGNKELQMWVKISVTPPLCIYLIKKKKKRKTMIIIYGRFMEIVLTVGSEGERGRNLCHLRVDKKFMSIGARIFNTLLCLFLHWSVSNSSTVSLYIFTLR